MSSSSPASRATLNFYAAEHYYRLVKNGGVREQSVRKARKEIACACYLKGLKILNEESEQIEPLDFLRLCEQERRILGNHIIP